MPSVSLALPFSPSVPWSDNKWPFQQTAAIRYISTNGAIAEAKKCERIFGERLRLWLENLCGKRGEYLDVEIPVGERAVCMGFHADKKTYSTC